MMTDNLLAGGGVPNTITNPVFKNSIFDAMISTEDGGYIFFGTITPKLIGLLLAFGAITFFFMFIWGAISWVLSGGDKAHVENAKNRVTSALIGIVLLASSFAIIGFIEKFFGINILSIDIGPLVIQ